jgi:hypothetical protein
MMAQPGLALHAQFPLAAPLSPVEQAILSGIDSRPSEPLEETLDR